MPHGVPTPEHIRAQIVAAYRTGASSTTLATRFGVGETTVATIVREAGISRPPGRPKQSEREDVAYRGGWTRDGLVWRPIKSGANA